MSTRVNALDGAIAELHDAPKVVIKGKKYSQVATRVEVFRKHFGIELGILTEIIEVTDQHVIIKASITRDGAPIATGMAEEVRGSSSINKTSALENCETSAIGRAMAAFGLHGGEYATADEVTRAIGQQNKPAEPDPFAESRSSGHVVVQVGEHGADWATWREQIEAQLDACEALGNINELAALNKAALETYREEEKESALHLSALFQAKRTALSQAPVEQAA